MAAILICSGCCCDCIVLTTELIIEMKNLRPGLAPPGCSDPTWNYLESGITVSLASLPTSSIYISDLCLWPKVWELDALGL